MPRFAVNQPIETREPTITVDAGLPAGNHRFQLVVFDAAGRRSAPDVVVVQIGGDIVGRPTIVRAPGPGVIDRVTPASGKPARRATPRKRGTDS